MTLCTLCTYWRLNSAKSAISSTIHSGKEENTLLDSTLVNGNCKVTLPITAATELLPAAVATADSVPAEVAAAAVSSFSAFTQ